MTPGGLSNISESPNWEILGKLLFSWGFHLAIWALGTGPGSYCQWLALKKARFGDYEGLTRHRHWSQQAFIEHLLCARPAVSAWHAISLLS